VKRIGPELKMPKLKGSEMKVPPFLSDLYFDLRDRRLLPLVVLILVAIVATPFLLAGGTEEPEPTPLPGVAGEAAPSSQRTLTVVKAAPGLRNYKKRLGHRDPTNPFKQRFTGPRLEGGQLNEVATSTSETGGTTTETTITTGKTQSHPVSGGGSSGGSEDNDGDGVPDGANLYTYVLDLQITRIETKPDGTVQKTGPNLRKNVKAPAPLPGEKAPVVTYLGMGATEPRAPMFLVSPDVTAIYGEGKCISGTGTCQLIALQRGFPVTFVYGENDVRYKINLLDVTGQQVEPAT
jgi:hypothetical protein